MKRKLVKQGQSTLMVSLPSKWIKSNNLDKGSEIELSEKENDLIISGKTSQIEKKEMIIRLNSDEETAIRTIITNAYRLNYDKIIVEFQNEDQYTKASRIVKEYLLGFEIILKEKKHFVIENITEPSIEHVENIFLKLLYNINEIISLTKNIMEKEYNDEYLNELENNIVRYDNFCRRVSSKQNNIKEPTQIKWVFYTQLVHGQREIFMLAKYLIENKGIKISAETKEYYSEIEEVFNLLKEGYLKKDIQKLEKIHELEKEIIYNKGYKLITSKKDKENIVIHRIMSTTRILYLASSPLIGLILWNQTVA